MAKIKIDSNDAFLCPMPMVLVGVVVDGKVNFLAVAWATQVNFNPNMMLISMGPHYSNKGIEEHKEFSINIPNVPLMEKTDYCGIHSGKKTDKAALFDVFYGELKNAPLIAECPVCISCKLFETVKLPADTLYIGEVKEAFTEERYTSDGKPDASKINPFALTMPGNTYWSLGERIGKAWSAGKNLKSK